MTLNAFFQVSVSVFCVIASIFMVVLFVWAVIFHYQFKRLVEKVEEIVEVAKTTAGEAKDFTERTIHMLETFEKSIFTFEFVRKIVTEIISLVKNKSKGASDGQTN